MFRKLLLLGLLGIVLALGACAKRGAQPESESAADTEADTSEEQAAVDEGTSASADDPSQIVTLRTPIPFGDSANVRKAVRDECRLQEKLAGFIEQFSAERNIEIRMSDGPIEEWTGKVLLVTITDTHAPGGGAFSGGKAVTVSGKLTQGDQFLGTFRARRISGGGAFAAFKGTCDILGRDVETLGSDIAGFLADPSEGARMGNI